MTAGRRLSVPAFLAIAAADVALIAVVGALSPSGLDGFDPGELHTTKDVALGLLVPIGSSLVFVYAVVAWLGWWRPVFVDRRPVQRWVWVVPAIFVVAIAVAIDYGALADKGAGFVAVLLLTTLCVGFSEEGLFRGIGVTVFRTNGFTEGKVALWSSVVFGAVHLSNALDGSGGGAVAQAVAVSFAGYFFYLTRRVSGGLLVPALIHSLFDFSLLSGSLGETTYAGGIGPILAYVVIALVLVARRHRIEPGQS